MKQAVSEPIRANSLVSSTRIHSAILILAIGVAFYLCWMMLRPFMAVITWAAALAILAHRFNGWLERRMSPNVAASISVFLIAVVVVAPAAVITQQLFVEVKEAIGSLGTEISADGWDAKLAAHPKIAGALDWAQANLDLNQQFKSASGAIAGKVSAWVSGSVWFFSELFLTFLTLFYFFRDRARLLRYFRRFIPLSKSETDEMFHRIAQAVNASLYGNLVVKLIQGVLGGLMFWILGLPVPVLSGALMALFAILPILGTAIVWIPAAIYLALTGSWVKAVILTIWGSLIVGLIDNFLVPVVVGGELRFHSLAVLFAVFGGLLAFGLAGLVLGPVILAVTVALLEIWHSRKGHDFQMVED